MGSTGERKPPAGFGNDQRYSVRKDASRNAVVVVDGISCPATVLGHNGPRTQVRFLRDGASYVQWFDTIDVAARLVS